MDAAILARHGESVFSARNLVNGDPSRPGPLTEAGREEARRLGDLLGDEPIRLYVVTGFQRTHETADIALAGRDIPRLVVPELNDPRAGQFEGGSLETMRAWLRSNGPAATPPGGGESRVEAVARYCHGYRLVLERPESVVLVLAHGLPITYALLGARRDNLPLTLETTQVPHAAAFRLSVAELDGAVEWMGRWAREAAAA